MILAFNMRLQWALMGLAWVRFSAEIMDLRLQPKALADWIKETKRLQLKVYRISPESRQRLNNNQQKILKNRTHLIMKLVNFLWVLTVLRKQQCYFVDKN